MKINVVARGDWVEGEGYREDGTYKLSLDPLSLPHGGYIWDWEPPYDAVFLSKEDAKYAAGIWYNYTILKQLGLTDMPVPPGHMAPQKDSSGFGWGLVIGLAAG